MGVEQPKVFISYNRADCDWAEWIAGAIERSGYRPIIQAWHFRPGKNFVLRMQEATAESDLTVAVLSVDYLNAEFTQSEWAAAFARDPTGKNRMLIPVRVAKCHLPIHSEIIYIDLVGRTEQDAERALVDGLKPSGKPAQPPQFPGKRVEPSISTTPFPPSLARLHGVPDLPPHYWPREADLARLKPKLLSGDASVAITGQGQALGVQRMGGIGKTVLAAVLAHDSEVRHAFPEGIYWLTTNLASAANLGRKIGKNRVPGIGGDRGRSKAGFKAVPINHGVRRARSDHRDRSHVVRSLEPPLEDGGHGLVKRRHIHCARKPAWRCGGIFV
jgi:hypothetical protein